MPPLPTEPKHEDDKEEEEEEGENDDALALVKKEIDGLALLNIDFYVQTVFNVDLCETLGEFYHEHSCNFPVLALIWMYCSVRYVNGVVDMDPNDVEVVAVASYFKDTMGLNDNGLNVILLTNLFKAGYKDVWDQPDSEFWNLLPSRKDFEFVKTEYEKLINYVPEVFTTMYKDYDNIFPCCFDHLPLEDISWP